MYRIFATVEHSGSKQTIDIFGFPTRPLWDIANVKDGEILFAHLRDEEMPAILEAAARMPIITTYRPEADIRASWVRRGKDLAELDRQLANYARIRPLAYVVGLGAFQTRTDALSRNGMQT